MAGLRGYLSSLPWPNDKAARQGPAAVYTGWEAVSFSGPS